METPGLADYVHRGICIMPEALRMVLKKESGGLSND